MDGYDFCCRLPPVDHGVRLTITIVGKVSLRHQTKKEPSCEYCNLACFSDSAGIQTRNLLIRSQMLYSVELRSLVLVSECKGTPFLLNIQIFLDVFLIFAGIFVSLTILASVFRHGFQRMSTKKRNNIWHYEKI